MKSAFLLLLAVALCAGDNKVAFITGASSGIGLETAKYLAANGMTVVLSARRVDKLEVAVDEITAAGGQAMHVKLDVTSEAETIAAFQAAEDKYGGVDYVFINAGFEGDTSHEIYEADLSVAKRVFDINVFGMFCTMKYAAIALKKRGGGAIVSVGSIAGTMTSDAFGFIGTGFAPYTISKGATDMMGRNGKGLLKDDIRFYNIKPAVYSSEMVDRLGGEDLTGFNPFFKGRVGEPKFLAEVVRHMFEGTTAWQPGQNIICDGDATFDSDLEYSIIEKIGRMNGPEDYKAAFRGADGREYKCTTESSCRIYNGEKEEI